MLCANVVLNSYKYGFMEDYYNMKKRILTALILMAVLVFTGCAKKDNTAAFGFNNGELTLTPGDKFNAEADSLSETTAYMEAASGYFDGLDKVFTYEGYEVTTFPKEDGDYIQDINISSETIKTDKGIGVGSSLSDVENAYGKGYTISGKMYEYYQDDTKYMYFFILNDMVQYYGYGMDVK